MPVQQIELEEVAMVEISDKTLEALVGVAVGGRGCRFTAFPTPEVSVDLCY